MALDMSNKIALAQKILPAIDFHVTSNGITVSASERLSTPKFLEFDTTGRCRNCRGTEAELDFIVTKEGVTIYCTRFREKRFIPFDSVNDLPGHCFFKIRNKGRVFNVPFGHSSSTENIVKQHNNVATKRKIVDQPPTSPPANKKQRIESEEAKMKKFYDSLSAATTFMDFAQRTKLGKQTAPQPATHEQVLHSPPMAPLPQEPPLYVPPPPPPPTQMPVNEQSKENLEPLLQEFYDSMAAATFHLDQKPAQQQQKIKKLTEQRKEIENSIRQRQ
jgi:hypothetical protein